MTPIETATTVKTTVNDPTIIKTVRAGKLPTRPDKLMEDGDPVKFVELINWLIMVLLI